MKKVYTNILPSGYKAMTIWPFIFIRKKAKDLFTILDERHENIHGRQQVEMLLVGVLIAIIMAACGCGWWSLLALPIYFWWYGVEWLVKGIYYRNFNTGYKNIGFEREAYANQEDVCYLDFRIPFAWIRYLTNYK